MMNGGLGPQSGATAVPAVRGGRYDLRKVDVHDSTLTPPHRTRGLTPPARLHYGTPTSFVPPGRRSCIIHAGHATSRTPRRGFVMRTAHRLFDPVTGCFSRRDVLRLGGLLAASAPFGLLPRRAA